MQINLFFDWLSNDELLTLKTGPPCINLAHNRIKHCTQI